MGVSEDFTIDELRNQYEVNFFGLFATTKAVIPQMKKQQQGLIVSISSGFGRTAMPLFEVYVPVSMLWKHWLKDGAMSFHILV
jgi:short-subunit dehydrogenase